MKPVVDVLVGDDSLIEGSVTRSVTLARFNLDPKKYGSSTISVKIYVVLLS